MPWRTVRRLLLATAVGGFGCWGSAAEAAEVTGVVSVLPGTSPVEGVSVTVRDHATAAIVAGATTDLGGNYAVTVPDGDYDFTFQPDPLSPLRAATPPTIHVSGDRVESIGLTRTGVFRLAGVVRDAAGDPVPGVTIQVNGSSSSASGQSAADGSFALALPAGTYDVMLTKYTATSGANAPHQWYALGKLTISGDRDEDIVIPAREVTVHAVDPNGQPITGATLDTNNAWISGTNTVLETPFNLFAIDDGAPTDTNGNSHLWLFDHTADSRQIRITPPPGSGLAAALLTLPTYTGDTTIDVTLPRSFRLAGVVRDAAGHPVPGVTIQVNGSSSSASGQSAADGSFALALPAGTYDVMLTKYTATSGANAPHQWYALGKLTISGDRDEDIVIPAREVTVHAVDPNGQPITGATLDTNNAWISGTNTVLETPFNLFAIDDGAPTDTNGNSHLWLFDHTADSRQIRITPPPAAASPPPSSPSPPTPATPPSTSPSRAASASRGWCGMRRVIRSRA